jgi:hypothetical protein
MGVNEQMTFVLEHSDGLPIDQHNARGSGRYEVEGKKRLRRIGWNIVPGRHTKAVTFDGT